jgi:phage tail-like protein
MSGAGLLPSIPCPPNDPTSLRLSSRLGWQAMASGLTNVQFGGREGALVLALQPGLRRSLGEPGGSFGGQRPPSNVAVGPGGEIYLLDQSTLELTIFDPCTCAFMVVPCFGGAGSAARQLLHPGSIGICAGNLFVCDTGTSRLGVFGLHGYVLRAYWNPPKAANLTQPWTPHSVAFDAKGRVYVSDPANGCIHIFSPAGIWTGKISGLGAVTYLATDCQDRLLAVLQTSLGGGPGPETRVVKPDGQTELLDPQTTGLFAPMPFCVDQYGRLHLGALCISESQAEPGCQTDLCEEDLIDSKLPEPGVFSPNGDPWVQPSGVLAKFVPPYLGNGRFLSKPLDSAIYRCQWHRVILEGETPPGSQVMVSTFTSEVPVPDSEIRALPDDAWDTQQVAHIVGGMWDCLVRSGAGRYLWLRLDLRSGGMVTPSLRSVEIEFPRISLRRFLPAVFGEEPVSADFTDRFLALFDTTLRSIERKLDRLAAYFDPLSAPAGSKNADDFLDWLASWIGISLERGWTEARKRKFLKQAGKIFPLRGTRAGLWRQLLLYLDMEPEQCCCPEDQPVERCTTRPLNCAIPEKKVCAWQPPKLILEHYQLRRWLFVGAGKLGDQAVLWGESIVNRSRLDDNAQAGITQLKMVPDPLNDPFLVYAHKYSVFVPGCFGNSEANRRSLENLLRRESPAHTSFDICYVEPRFRIGIQSTIGLDAVIGRIPQGVMFESGSLGKDTVLTSSTGTGGPSLRVGRTSRIGGSTRLD